MSEEKAMKKGTAKTTIEYDLPTQDCIVLAFGHCLTTEEIEKIKPAITKALDISYKSFSAVQFEGDITITAKGETPI